MIFGSLLRNKFTQVQGCLSAKEAWDILQVSFECTNNVKRTRLDMLASEFENLTMEVEESVDDFNGKLSSITQEAVVLGKTYKDKKMVKKFLRSLSDKLQSHKSAIDVSLNSDQLKSDQVVWMMHAYDTDSVNDEPGFPLEKVRILIEELILKRKEHHKLISEKGIVMKNVFALEKELGEERIKS